MRVGEGEGTYLQYQREMSGPRMTRAVRTAVFFVLGLNTLFMLLDVWWADADRYLRLQGCRIGLDAAMIALFWAAPRVNPIGAAIAGCLITGAGMIGVTIAAGGITTDYWPALMLLFLGIPVMLPLSGRQVAGPAVVLLTAFASIPIITGEEIDLRRYLVPSFFGISGAFVCVASCALLDRLRFSDFGQRRELEAARDHLKSLDQAKSRFTANVHHELRTPLTLMLAPLEAMLAGDFGETSDGQRRYLRTMHVNGLRLLKLINNLLDLAKVESHQLELHRRPCDVGRLVDDVVAGARPLAEQKRIELSSEGLEGLPRIHVDPDAVEKVVVNLVGNALKFTDAGGRIVVRGEAAEDGGLHLVVADSGIGLEQEQVERIFDRFAQVDTSATRRHEGTGIGLSLAKELVEAHQGRIWAESRGLGHGTQMHVLLPPGEADVEGAEEVIQTASGEGVALARSLGAVEAELNLETAGEGRLLELQRSVERWRAGQAEGEEDEPGLAEGQEPARADAPEVLVVEDNAEMRRLLAFVVGREYRVRTARNGREALDAVRERAPDLVLTDVMMPEMSGTELCRAIRGDPETAGLPVVLVTSKAEREMKIEGLEGGADDYVTKPFHPRELLARVRALVRLRQLQRDLEERNRTLERMNEELERALADLKEAEVAVLQAERLAAVGELAAGVAHEVNNPVNFALNALRTLGSQVQALAELARALSALDASDPAALARQFRELEHLRGELAPQEAADELLELVAIVSEGLERTYRLVGNLRDLAGPGHGARLPVNLRRGIESTLQLLGRDLQEAGVTVRTDLGREPLVVQGDAGALNQVFLNLLKNSAEALEGSCGTVWIEARRQGAWVELAIRDDGPGIPADVRERLFEPFFSTKEAGRGSGLGLSICRRIMKEHGGTIELSSPPGTAVGAAFTIRLPVEGAEPTHEA